VKRNPINAPHDRYDYSHFLRWRAVGSAGYSIRIYHVTLEQANCVRRELGLPELSEDWGREEENLMRPSN